MKEFNKEKERIQKVYEKRYDFERIKEIYTLFNPASLFTFYQREKKLLNLLKKYGFNHLEDKKILDVGCGYGGVLRRFIDYGALPENLYGIDLLADRIETAKKLSPHINFYLGSATELPFENEFFDIVIQFTVFTSILDYSMKQKIAKEMLRVLKPDGIIIWYDYWISKPTNPDVKGVGKQEIKKLFPNCKFEFHRITLAPPIARLLVPISWMLCELLEKIRIFNTHYLAIIKK
mgnify:CR=1 FL=1